MQKIIALIPLLYLTAACAMQPDGSSLRDDQAPGQNATRVIIEDDFAIAILNGTDSAALAALIPRAGAPEAGVTLQRSFSSGDLIFSMNCQQIGQSDPLECFAQIKKAGGVTTQVIESGTIIAALLNPEDSNKLAQVLPQTSLPEPGVTLQRSFSSFDGIFQVNCQQVGASDPVECSAQINTGEVVGG